MITILKRNKAEKAPMELAGLSTDTKPTGTQDGYPITNASTFLEMDTGSLYWYNEASGKWIK